MKDFDIEHYLEASNQLRNILIDNNYLHRKDGNLFHRKDNNILTYGELNDQLKDEYTKEDFIYLDELGEVVYKENKNSQSPHDCKLAAYILAKHQLYNCVLRCNPIITMAVCNEKNGLQYLGSDMNYVTKYFPKGIPSYKIDTEKDYYETIIEISNVFQYSHGIIIDGECNYVIGADLKDCLIGIDDLVRCTELYMMREVI